MLTESHDRSKTQDSRRRCTNQQLSHKLNTVRLSWFECCLTALSHSIAHSVSRKTFNCAHNLNNTESVTRLMTILTLKVLNFWKFTSYCSLKPLWLGMGDATSTLKELISLQRLMWVYNPTKMCTFQPWGNKIDDTALLMFSSNPV